MLRRFIDYIHQQHLFPSGQQVLLAVSGGIDSVVLTHLVHSAGYPFAIAHCNFHLRPGDCDRDEAFVRQLAAHYGAPIYVVQFSTQEYASQHHLCIEDAARRLRYDFFEQVRQREGYSVIVTAHHRDDAAETFFLNLLRGTGLSGLHGILPAHDHIVRPLLPFGREEIERYATENHLTYVEDVTNASLQYRRNQVRHQLMPLLRDMQPAVDDSLQLTIKHLQSVERLYHYLLDSVRQQFVQAGTDGTVRISLDLPAGEVRSQLLYELLHPYGFNVAVVEEILSATQSGKTFRSDTYEALLDRGCLVVTPIIGVGEESFPAIHIEEIGKTVPLSQFSFAQPEVNAYFDADAVRLPLTLRHWCTGDRFQPLGVQGTQLVSDFFTDHKYSLQDKQRQLLLVDASDAIIWIVGHRTSHPHRVTDHTRTILKVSLINE